MRRLRSRALIEAAVEPTIRESVPWAVCRHRVDILVRLDGGVLAIGFPHAGPEVADQFFQGFKLLLGRFIPIVIAYKADPERNVVEVIRADMAAIELGPPAGADLDRSVPGGGAIADDEVIRKTVLHFANIPVVIIERLGISLPRTGVVHDNVDPAMFLDGSLVDGRADGRSQVFVLGGPPEETPSAFFGRWRRNNLFGFGKARFLDDDGASRVWTRRRLRSGGRLMTRWAALRAS